MHSYIILDTEPLIEKVVINSPPRVSALNPDSGAENINCYFGGPCYPISKYVVTADIPVVQLWQMWSVNDVANSIGNPVLTASNMGQVASQIKSELEFMPGVEADVDIQFIPLGTRGTFTITIDTNAPLGEVKFRIQGGDYSDPSNIIVTGFTKV